MKEILISIAGYCHKVERYGLIIVPFSFEKSCDYFIDKYAPLFPDFEFTYSGGFSSYEVRIEKTECVHKYGNTNICELCQHDAGFDYSSSKN